MPLLRPRDVHGPQHPPGLLDPAPNTLERRELPRRLHASNVDPHERLRRGAPACRVRQSLKPRRRDRRDEVELPPRFGVQRGGSEHARVAQCDRRPARRHPRLPLDLVQLHAAIGPAQRELGALRERGLVLHQQRRRLASQHAQQLADGPLPLVALTELRRLTTRTWTHGATVAKSRTSLRPNRQGTRAARTGPHAPRRISRLDEFVQRASIGHMSLVNGS
jgi:hypothetical protein